MLRSQTHDKGRESKGEFTRCVYRALGVAKSIGEDSCASVAGGPLVLELVATARRENGTFLLTRHAARASVKIAGNWSPKFFDEKNINLRDMLSRLSRMRIRKKTIRRLIYFHEYDFICALYDKVSLDY